MSGVIRKLLIHLCFSIHKTTYEMHQKIYFCTKPEVYICVNAVITGVTQKRLCDWFLAEEGKRLQHTFMQNKLGELRRFVRKVDI